MKAAFLALAAMAVTLLSTSAQAADVAAGRAIAQRYCGECHSIAAKGDSPAPAAPPFRDLFTRYPPEDLAESLAEGISVGHPMMPQLEMSSRQIDDFVAFLHTLEQGGKAKPGR